MRASDELAERILAFLANHHVLSLATVGEDGPRATNLFYACDDLALVWVSADDARHSRDVDTDPRVAVTIAPDCEDFTVIRGLQINGTAHRVIDPAERSRLRRLIERRYPFLQRLDDAPAKLREAYAGVSVYRLEPSRIVLIDNTKGFGHKETLTLAVASTAVRGKHDAS